MERMKKILKNHRRDMHLNLSNSTSPPPKRKRPLEEQYEPADILMDTDEIVTKIEELNIKENKETEDQHEKKRRSDMMDQKVKAIERRREEEERKYQERRKAAEKIRVEKEEEDKAKLKEDIAKKNNLEKKRKLAQKKEEALKQRGITKLPAKYNSLVGEYNNLLKMLGDGSCQSSAKAAILLQDPSRGPQLAIEENSYIVEHWEKLFSKFFVFPHTLQLGGGQTQVCQTDKEFLQFLVLNPDVSFMWADHHQLAVTCNLYNTKIQVLTIDSKGEGSLLSEPITPNPEMAPYSLIPPTKPNGEKVDVPEVWLRYTNNNHYDALLKDDHPLVTQGSLKERGFPEEKIELKQKQVENDVSRKIMHKCDDCNFSFISQNTLDKHKKNRSY